MNRADAAPARIVGVDFSGGVRAGNKIWIASGRIEDDQLAIETCAPAADLPRSGPERATCLAALRVHLAGLGPAVVGLDFPFSLPRALISEPTWGDFAVNFAARYPTADAFQRESRAVAIAATGQPEPKRRTDVDARTPFAANNLRLYRQTYYGLHDLLGPLVADGAVSVLPMMPPHPDRSWLIEICPASTLKRLGSYQPYKGRPLADVRARLLTAVASRLSLSIPDDIRALAIAEPEGDALDSIIAAAATAHALQRGSLTTCVRLRGWSTSK